MVRAGDLIDDRFLIEHHAGSGGMGQVYRARDKRSGDEVALKILQSQGAHEMSRFAREAQALAALRLPGVVRYVAHGVTSSGQPYLAMQWLPGETLSDRLARSPLSIDETIALGSRVATTLGAVHTLGLVHRDLKPSNLVLLDGDVEHVTLIDFGIARVTGLEQQLTRTGAILGTPGYMAPEQARGQLQIDARADVFSLGCVLYKCVSGRAPFQGSGLALLAKVLVEEPPRLRELRAGVPDRLDLLIARMLSKTPDRRPRDGIAVAAELASIHRPLEGDDAAQPPESAPSTPEITNAERRVLCVVLALSPSSIEDVTRSETEVDEQDDVLRVLATRYHARLELLDGRAPLFVLSGAGTATDLAVRAAHCALAVHALLGTPVALATCRAALTARLPVADLIDLAFRLLPRTTPESPPSSAQGPGTRIYVDEMSAGLLGARFELTRERDAFALQRAQASLDTLPELLGKPTPCVGRDREVTLLLGEWEHCVEERTTRAVLVIGAAGLGKSRLRQEVLRLVRERDKPVELWLGQADPMAAGSAFGLLGRALRRAVGLLDGEPIEAQRQKLLARVARHPALAANAAHTAAFLGEMLGVEFPGEGDVQLQAARQSPMLMGDQIRRAWEDFCHAEAAERPVLLVLEDLHWGDLPTVNLVEAALRHLKGVPFMVLAMGRPEVHQLFPRLWDERATSVNLTPLSRRAGERLVRAALGEGASAELVAKLVSRADGNAFFLEEQIRASAEGRGEELPETVLAMVQARLDALDPEARRVLRAASIFGETFWEGGVAALVGGMQVGPWLSELERREVISRRGKGRLAGEIEFRFRHGLVREAGYAMLPERDKRIGHALAGEWLERAGEGEAIALATHFEIGGVLGRAAGMFLRAAEQALRGNDLTAAIERAERGVLCGRDPAMLGSLRRVQAEAHIWRGDLALAQERGTEAIERLEAGSVGWYSAITQVVLACAKLGSTDVMARWIEAARRTAPSDEARSVRNACLLSGAMELLLCGRHAATDELLDEAQPSMIEGIAHDVDVAAKRHEVRACRAMSEDPSQGAACLEAALAAYEEAGNRRNVCSTRANLGFVYCELGDLEPAEASLRAALEAAERMGLQDVAAGAQSNLGLVLALRGQVAEAQRMEAAALATSRKMGHAHLEVMARSYLAMIAVMAGDLDLGEQEARAAVELAAQMPPARARALAVLARVLLGLGRAPEALDAATSAHSIMTALGTIEEGESLIRLVYAESLAASGLRAEAAAAITSARDALLARAERLTEPRWRALFLQRVPDNVRTLELARAYLGEGAQARDSGVLAAAETTFVAAAVVTTSECA